MFKFKNDFKSRFRILKGGKISLLMSAMIVSIFVNNGNANVVVDGNDQGNYSVFYEGTFTETTTDTAIYKQRDTTSTNKVFEAQDGGDISLGDGDIIKSMLAGTQASTDPYETYYFRFVVYFNPAASSEGCAGNSSQRGGFDFCNYIFKSVDVETKEILFDDGYVDTVWDGKIDGNPLDELNELTGNLYLDSDKFELRAETNDDYDYGSASSATTYAINATGTVTLAGNNTIDGTLTANELILSGNNNIFNGEVSIANGLNVSSSADATMSNGSDLIGNVSFSGVSSSFNLSTGSDIQGNISTSSDNKGTLNVQGSSTITGTVGTDSLKLKEINAGADSSSSTFKDDVYATTITNTGTGIINFEKNVTATDVKINNGTVSLLDNANITATNISTSSNNTGTLNLQGSSTITGTVGTSTLKLKEVNAGADSSSSTFKDDVYATTITNTGTGEVSFEKNVTATDVKINNGTVSLLDNANITATNISTTTNNTGTLNLQGSSTITGTVGTSSLKLKEVNAGADSSSSTFNNMVYAENLKFLGNGTVALNGTNSNSTLAGMIGSVDLGDNNGTLEIGDEVNLTTGTGGIEFLNANNASLVFSGSSIVNGVVGGNTEGKSTFETIYAGKNSEIVTFKNDVYATTITNTGTGTINFEKNVTATDVNIATGTVSFNTDNTDNTSTTSSNIEFTDNGIANLKTGLTGNIDFGGNASSTVNVSDGKGITGSISTSSDSTGILNYLGDGLLSDIVGTVDEWVASINVNTNNEQDTNEGLSVSKNIFVSTIDLKNDANITLLDNANITATNISTTTNNTGTLNLQGSSTITGTVGTVETDSTLKLKEVNAGADSSSSTFKDDVYATTITNTGTGEVSFEKNVTATDVKINNGTVSLLDNANITATNISTTTNNTGTLNLQGSSTITGTVGTSSLKLKEVNAGADSSSSTFNNMVYAENLKFLGNGTVALNGTNSNSTLAGMIGSVDLGDNNGTLEIGDEVNLTTGTGGIEFLNANNASLVFSGSSIVNGVVGGNTEGKSTFETIYAGKNSEIVTFKNDVYVKEGTQENPATLHVNGTGTVNLEGDLYGDLVFDSDGTVNISSEKSIIISNDILAVKTVSGNTGTLNFLGSTLLSSNLGEENHLLKEINFNTSSNNIIQSIDKNIYANTTNIGSINGNSSLELTNVTAEYDFAGGNTIKEFTGGGTVINVEDGVSFAGDLTLANNTTAVNVGKSHISIAKSLTTNNSAMNFIIDTSDITGLNNANAVSSGSGRITLSESLNMSGDERIHINYLGSLSDNGSYKLIDSNSSTGTYEQSEVSSSLVSDNSSIIDTLVKMDDNDLFVIADRTSGGNNTADELYIVKSNTQGHFSNDAAKTIASISAQGMQTGDMVEVIQKLELDSYGYGNTPSKLANELKKLTPTANTSFIQTSISASNGVTNTVNSRISSVRGLSSGEEVLDSAVWGKIVASSASQNKVGEYDGYNLDSNGIVFGVDKELKNGMIVGLATGYTLSNTKQEDLKIGDSSSTKSYQLSLYGSKTYGNIFVDGSLSYTKHKSSGNRATAIDRSASYKVDTNQISAKVDSGYSFNIQDDVILTPSASLEYSHIIQDNFTETGAGALNLSVDDVSINRGAVGLGVKVSKNINIGSNSITPALKVGATKYFGDKNVYTSAQFQQGDKFITKSSDMIDTIYNVETSINTQLSDTMNVSLSADYEKNEDGSFEGANGQLSFRINF